MAEYIERDFVLNGIDTVIVAAKGIAGDNPISIKTVSIIKNIRAFIDSVPAADVAPVVPELRKAVNLLKEEYEKAKHNPIVRDPLAFALYQTWNAVDG